MIPVIVAAAAAFTPPSLRASAPGMSAATKPLPAAQQRSFRRAKLLDIFESVSEKEVVNVLGRWQSYKQWDTAGSLRQMDRLFDQQNRKVERRILSRAVLSAAAAGQLDRRLALGQPGPRAPWLLAGAAGRRDG